MKIKFSSSRTWKLYLCLITFSKNILNNSFIKNSELWKSGILWVFFKKSISYQFNKCTTVHLTWKFPFWVFKRCSLAHFESQQSFWQKWVKISEWSTWLGMIYLTFRVLRRCSFQMRDLFSLILCISKVLGKFGWKL